MLLQMEGIHLQPLVHLILPPEDTLDQNAADPQTKLLNFFQRLKDELPLLGLSKHSEWSPLHAPLSILNNQS